MSDLTFAMMSAGVEAFIQQAAGQISGQEKTFVPKHSRSKLLRELPVEITASFVSPKAFQYHLRIVEEIDVELTSKKTNAE